MISKKVCMVGGFAVGKTSLVQRFVENIYDERYLTTVGVKIDKKVVWVDDTKVNIILWDLAGEDAFRDLKLDYVRGASGFILVADGTRRETLETAVSLRERIHKAFGPIPFVIAINKVDVEEEWEVEPDQIEFFEDVIDWPVFKTSALDGTAVQALFEHLAEAMVRR